MARNLYSLADLLRILGKPETAGVRGYREPDRGDDVVRFRRDLVDQADVLNREAEWRVVDWNCCETSEAIATARRAALATLAQFGPDSHSSVPRVTALLGHLDDFYTITHCQANAEVSGSEEVRGWTLRPCVKHARELARD